MSETLRLFPFQTVLHLTTGVKETFEFTAFNVETAVRGAVRNFQQQNPTKRVEYAYIYFGGELLKWLPHLEGWEHEQPQFIKAPRRDGHNPVAGTEL